MKSARMLIAVVAVGGLGLTGCMEARFGIVPPIRSKPFVDMTGPNMPATQPAAQAMAKPEGAPASDGEASNDPAVNALAQQIDAMSLRPITAKPEKAPDQQVSPSPNPGADNTATAANRTEGAASADRSAPVEANRTLANGPVRDRTARSVASAERAGTPDPPAPVLADVAASPAPRPEPVIQPSPAAAQAPVASANVGVEIVEVRPVMGVTAVAPAAAPGSPNQPAEPGRVQQPVNLSNVISQLEQALEQQPPTPEDVLRLRLLYLAAGMDDKSTAPVNGMDPVQAELLTAIVKTVASTRQSIQQPQNSSTAALTCADELRRLLGQQLGVSIPRVALVTKVNSFGDYEAISPLRFKQGNEIHAYVYTEISNFRSEPMDGDRLHTLVSEQVQVFDAAGKSVWERNEPKIEDVVRTPRRDFFIPFPLHLPASLPPGDYVVKVTVEDRIGGTTDQQRLSFSIQ